MFATIETGKSTSHEHPSRCRGVFHSVFHPPDRYGTSIIISFNDLFHLITRAHPLLFYLRSETFISQNSDTKDADQRNRSGGFLIISFPPVILSCVQYTVSANEDPCRDGCDTFVYRNRKVKGLRTGLRDPHPRLPTKNSLTIS